MSTFAVHSDDPQAADVGAVLEAHLAFNNQHSPPEDVHALDVTGLLAEDVSFFSIRESDRLLGIGALKQLEAGHAEIKSIHTATAARRRGVGRAMLDHLLALAQTRGFERVSLETGSMEAFAPARTLYASAGFAIVADYAESANSVFMTLVLERSPPA